MSFLEGFDNMNGFSNAMGTMSSLRANQQRAEMANQQSRDTYALRKEQAEQAEQQSRDTNALKAEAEKTNKLLEQQVEMEKEKNRIAQDKLAAEAKERQDTLEFRNLLGQSNTLLSLMKSRIC